MKLVTLEKAKKLLEEFPQGVKIYCHDGFYTGNLKTVVIKLVWSGNLLAIDESGSQVTLQDDLRHFSFDEPTVTHPAVNVLQEIRDLRDAQIEKWGNDDNHTVMEFVSIIAEEFGKVAKKSNHYHYNQDEIKEHGDLRQELVSLAAVTVAMIEYIDRKQE